MPDAYTRRFSFSGFQANQPNIPVPGPRLDIESDDIAGYLARAGASAYQIAVLNGFVGSETDFLVSLKGEPGSAGTGDSVIAGIAAVVTGGHKVLYARLDGSGLASASASDATQAGLVIGVSTAAALAHATITYVNDGPVDEPTRSFVAGPVWLGEAGNVVQTPPSHGFVQVVGTAVTPTRIVVSIQTPFILAA